MRKISFSNHVADQIQPALNLDFSSFKDQKKERSPTIDLASTVVSEDSFAEEGTEAARAHIAVAYVDEITREGAMCFCAGLEQRRCCEFTWWKFQHLSHPLIKEAAIFAASKAQAVIFSMHHDQDLPPFSEEWIEKSQNTSFSRVLVALIHGNHFSFSHGYSVYSQAKDLARRAQMMFFSPIRTA